MATYWQQLLAGGAFIVWLIRLEGRVNSNEARIGSVENHDKTIAEIHTSVTKVQNDVAWLKNLGGQLLKVYKNQGSSND